MTNTTHNLTNYYAAIQQTGQLRTATHAQQWSRAVLNTLGLTLDRGTKKELAKALPEELAVDLKRVFWLAHFRNSGMSRYEFFNQVSRRGGNSDPDFARYPTTAVFHQLKTLTSQEVSSQVAETLSPDMRQLWEEA